MTSFPSIQITLGAARSCRRWLGLAALLLLSSAGALHADGGTFDNPIYPYNGTPIYYAAPGTSFTLSGGAFSSTTGAAATRVEIYVDNILIGDATLTPYSNYWKWTKDWTVTPGTHVFHYKIYFASGSPYVATASEKRTATFEATNRPPVAKSKRQMVLPGTSTPIPCYFHEDNAKQTITAGVVQQAAHGIVTSNGSTVNMSEGGLGRFSGFTYAPEAGFTGIDSFTYKVNDGYADSQEATVFLQVRNPNERLGNTVILLVNSNLYSVLAGSIDRLKTDIEAEGYVGKIIQWPASGTTTTDVWNRLRAEYLDTNQWVEGAILIGDIPKPKTTAAMASEWDPVTAYNDLIYWCMAEYNNLSAYGAPTDIWVSRINADDTSWGAQEALIARYLDANHDYRSGRSRLPATAFSYTIAQFPNNVDSGLQLKTVWPDERIATGSPTFSTRTDLGIGGCDALVVGGEIFESTSHGSYNTFMVGSPGTYDKAKCYRSLAQNRSVLVEGCSAGNPGG